MPEEDLATVVDVTRAALMVDRMAPSVPDADLATIAECVLQACGACSREYAGT